MKLLALTLLLLTIGCRSSRPSYNFPEPRAQFHGELNNARAVVRQVGQHPVKDKSLRVQLITGQRKIRGVWAWSVTYPGLPPNLWVTGLYFAGGRMEIGSNAAGAEIHWASVFHEMIHHMLFNVGVQTHHPAYDSRVYNWAYSRRVTGRSMDELIHTDILVVDPVHRAVRISGFVLPPDDDFEPLLRPIPLFPQDR